MFKYLKTKEVFMCFYNNRILVIIFVFLLFNYLHAGVVINKISNELTQYRVDLSSDLVNVNEITLNNIPFFKITLNDFNDNQGILFKEGFPELPTIYFYIEGEIKDIRFSLLNPINFNKFRNLPYLIYPSQPSLKKEYSSLQQILINNDIYNSDKIYPTVAYEIKKVGYKNFKPLYLLILYPIAYIPKQNIVLLRNHFEFIVQTAENNPDTKSRENKNIPQTILFVVGEKFKDSPSLLNYAQHYYNLGYFVQYLNVDSTYTPEQIRQGIQQVYKSHDLELKYVIIIGDIEDVTSYKTDLIWGQVTDHYYASLDDPYDQDIGAPDVAVSRISVNSESELKYVLFKNLKYLYGNFLDQSWLSYISFIATDDKYLIAEGSHNYAISNYTAPLGYKGTFPQDLQQGGDKLYAITYSAKDEDVVTRMNQGRLIINYSGHGMDTYWVGPRVYQEDVQSISHPDALPFVISNACLTGNFMTKESFAETWLRHPNGSIMFWGSMGSTYWDEDDILEKKLYDAIFQKNLYSFAEMTKYALSQLWAYYNGLGKSNYYWETYHMFGDPVLNLRTSAVKWLEVDFPVVVSHITSQIKIFVKQEYKPVADVKVILFNHNDKVWIYSSTHSDGVAKIDINNLKRPIRLNLVIIQNNSKPYFNSIFIQ